MKRAGFFARSDLGRSIWTFRREFFWVGVFSFFANLMMLTPTLYMLQVFDRVMLSQNEFTLIAVTLVAVLFFMVMAFAEWVRSRLMVRAGVRFDNFLNSRVFDATFSAGLSQAKVRNNMQAFADLTSVRQFLTGQGTFAFFDLPWTPIYLGVLFMMHPVLGWTSIGFALFLGAFAWVGQKLTARRQELALEGVVHSNAFLGAKLRNAETVHAMGMLGSLRSKWLGLYEGHLGTQASAQEAQQRLAAATKFIQYTQQSIILSVGALLVIRGELSVGAMIASNALMNNSLRPITTLSSTWRQFVEARKGYGRLEQLLEDHPARQSEHVAEQVQGQVTLVNLVATAPGREQPILRGLNAQFAAGEVVAIVGPSGAGKSTLARCILGIWPDTTGQVQLDGQPIAAWSRDELGPHIGYLPQDIELFEGTLADNIARFGELDSKAVVEAATRTGIHEMILRFPKGYDTPMGEAGSLLSGGQRQRVGLARAMYGDPQLIVLDEPNANLDDAGVSALVAAVKDMKARGKTVFMVVHQMNLLSTADKVLVLENGSIARFGPLTQVRT